MIRVDDSFEEPEEEEPKDPDTEEEEKEEADDTPAEVKEEAEVAGKEEMHSESFFDDSDETGEKPEE